MRLWKADEKIQFNRSLTHCISHELHKRISASPLLFLSFFPPHTSPNKAGIISIVVFFLLFFLRFSPPFRHFKYVKTAPLLRWERERKRKESERITCISCSNSVLRRRISTSSCCSAGVRSVGEKQTKQKKMEKWNEYQGRRIWYENNRPSEQQ